MGSGFSRLLLPSCLKAAPEDTDLIFASGPLDETLGHSFCYVRSSARFLSPSQSDRFSPSHSARFKSISGASVSANTSTPRTVLQPDLIHQNATDPPNLSSTKPFESTSSFGVIPLQPLPPGADSGPLDRGFFMSGPIERGAVSGPLDGDSSAGGIPFSAPLGGAYVKSKKKKRFSRKSFNRSFSVVPVRNFVGGRKDNSELKGRGEFGENVQWAHGMAGEDRVHVVVSEDQRWLFFGIYDGFNGPDAPEFLMGNLYRAVFNELDGLFWDETSKDSATVLGQQEDKEGIPEVVDEQPGNEAQLSGCGKDLVKKVTFQSDQVDFKRGKKLWELLAEGDEEDDGLDLSGSSRYAFSIKCINKPPKRRTLSFPNLKYGFNRPKERDDWEVKERLGQSFRKYKVGPIDHDSVLRALSRALEATELAYLEMTDKVLDRNPELALMGSCLLVVLMKDEDVYMMNVGDSRAIVAQYQPQDLDPSAQVTRDQNGGFEEEGIVEAIEAPDQIMRLSALQLSTDHSTSIEEEVLRIKAEHPDDPQCILNDRVKGRLKVTRAFGAGFLKQPKWNNALLEMFRNEYIGTAPYISCSPSVCHHKLGPTDHFLVLSSDGLYQYLTNQEVVSFVESFMEKFPDGDPAQHLIEELLFRAAKKAGMDFHELLDIPQGDRRKYHDDVTVMVISLEGRIWKSSGKYL
ncbi:protein phosphatase 2C 29-like [Aristolochia californica]|uniref:protein phosphatase 2C 29-like n=1 Tax=Aristolochia californica TaxID=171875 RepID=UPI0035D65B74